MNVNNQSLSTNSRKKKQMQCKWYWKTAIYRQRNVGFIICLFMYTPTPLSK